MSIQQIECPLCRGSRACPECDGFGENDLTFPGTEHGYESYVDPVLELCFRCQGQGECPRCYGEGQIYLPTDHQVEK